MSFEIQAIFENGVLRPLTPLVLADQEQVTLTVKQNEHTEDDADVVARQRTALAKMLAEISALPDEPLKDNFANDDDRDIYGSIK